MRLAPKIKIMFKNNSKKISILFVLCFLLFGLFTIEVEADIVSDSIENPLEADNFTELIANIIGWISNIGKAVAVIMIIYAGLLFMISGGNEEKITKAKKTLIWSLIGLGVLIIGDGFVNIVKNLLG